MQPGRLVLLWIARHLLAFLLILAVLIAGQLAYQWGWPMLQHERREANEIGRQTQSLRSARVRLREYARVWPEQAEARTRALRGATVAQLRQRLSEIPSAIERRQQARLSSRASFLLAAARGRTDRIVGHYEAGVEIAWLEHERQSITALLRADQARNQRRTDRERRRRAVERHNRALAVERAASGAIGRLQRRTLAGPRNWLCGTISPPVACTHYRTLIEARQRRDSARAARQAAARTVHLIDLRLSGQAVADAAMTSTAALAGAQVDAIERELRALDEKARENWWTWLRRPIVEMWDDALLILAIAIFGPALVKALLYFVVAPAASRRRPLRLCPDELGEADSAGFASAVSQRIGLNAGEALLVVPEAVQSSPNEGAKSTRWLLNPAMPLSSLASGMVALLRFRGDGGSVEVAATGDPLAEIALVQIPPGSAMVVRPRALRGIVHPADRAVRITRHWRFGASAWLALRFRHLVFHGPCTLIVQGSRGVRLEPAGGGRGINRAATIAFSAGLDLSVRRSEAFAPYLMGRQDLLNHSFAGGPGLLVREEMPRSGQRSGLWGRGLAGLGDAALKTVGL